MLSPRIESRKNDQPTRSGFSPKLVTLSPPRTFLPRTLSFSPARASSPRVLSPRIKSCVTPSHVTKDTGRLVIEDLVEGANEWRNIQDVIRFAFKALHDMIKSQDEVVKYFERQMETKASVTDVQASLHRKANIADVNRTLTDISLTIEEKATANAVELKADKADISAALKLKAAVADLSSKAEIQDVEATWRKTELQLQALSSRIDEIGQETGRRALAVDFEEWMKAVRATLALKLDRTEWDTARAEDDASIKGLSQVHNVLKADHELVARELRQTKDLLAKAAEQTAREAKRGQEDFAHCVERVQDALAQRIERADREARQQCRNLTKDLSAVVARVDAIEPMLRATDGHHSELQDALEKHVKRANILAETLKLQTQAHDEGLEKLTQKAAEAEKELQGLQGQLQSQAATLNEGLEDLKRRSSESEARLTKDIDACSRTAATLLDETAAMLRSELKDKVEADVSDAKQELGRSLDSSMQQVEDLIAQTARRDDVMKALESKADKREVEVVTEELQAVFQRGLMLKADKLSLDLSIEEAVSQLRRSMADKREMEAAIEGVQGQLKRATASKAETSEVDAAVEGLRAQIECSLATLLDREEADAKYLISLRFDEAISTIMYKLAHKVDVTREAQIEANITGRIQDCLTQQLALLREIRLKVDKQEMKVLQEQIQESLIDVHAQLNLKASSTDLASSLKVQMALSRAVASELCVGRWIWKSLKTKTGGVIPWNIETVNLDPENYIWEKDRGYIACIAPGLYELQLSFYSRRRPVVKIHVNSEPIYTITSGSQAITCHAGGRLLSSGRFNSSGITGMTFIDFIALPAKSRISITYQGDEEAEAFIGLRKLGSSVQGACTALRGGGDTRSSLSASCLLSPGEVPFSSLGQWAASASGLLLDSDLDTAALSAP